MATIQNLPCEVLSDIFIRLLAKEVAQMRSVCKSWNALLSDSSFIKSHRHHSVNKKDEILLFFRMGLPFEIHPKPFRVRPSSSPDLKLTNFIKPPVIPQIKNGFGFVIGSVNGLICFVYELSLDDYVVYVWNPSLSAILSLPPLSLPSGRSHFGFGFDQKTDDYKFVKLTSVSRVSDRVAQAEVYSMRKGSWESISQSLPSHMTIIGGRDNQVFVNDHLHWLCVSDLESKPQTILGFDLGAHAFSEIPLPQTIQDLEVYEPCNVLGVLSGKLCVMSCVRDGKCEVWVMDEYGVPESWAKHHAFSQFSGDIFPYGFTSHGEFLFQVGPYDDGFGLYDPIAAKTKHFKLMSRNCSMMKHVEYVDSLVWIPPPNREIRSCNTSQLQIGK